MVRRAPPLRPRARYEMRRDRELQIHTEAFKNSKNTGGAHMLSPPPRSRSSTWSLVGTAGVRELLQHVTVDTCIAALQQVWRCSIVEDQLVDSPLAGAAA